MCSSQIRLLRVLAVAVVAMQRPPRRPASAAPEPLPPERQRAGAKAGTQWIYQGSLNGAIAIDARFGSVGTQMQWQVRIRDLDLGEWDGLRARASLRSFTTP